MGRALVELGYISEWELAKAVAKELGVPFIRLKQSDVLSEGSRLLDPADMHQHLFFPLDRFDTTDTVVVAEPPTLDLLAKLTPILGERVFFLVSLISDVVRVLEHAVPLDAEALEIRGNYTSAEEILSGFQDD
jgi:type IV pilus assembly protein PilB